MKSEKSIGCIRKNNNDLRIVGKMYVKKQKHNKYLTIPDQKNKTFNKE